MKRRNLFKMFAAVPLLAVPAAADEPEETWTHETIHGGEVAPGWVMNASVSSSGDALYELDGCTYRTSFEKEFVRDLRDRTKRNVEFDLVPALIKNHSGLASSPNSDHIISAICIGGVNEIGRNWTWLIMKTTADDPYTFQIEVSR